MIFSIRHDDMSSCHGHVVMTWRHLRIVNLAFDWLLQIHKSQQFLLTSSFSLIFGKVMSSHNLCKRKYHTFSPETILYISGMSGGLNYTA